MYSSTFGERLFPEAARQWLESRKSKLSPRTYQDYLEDIRTLARFFGLMRLRDIHIGHVHIYQRSRQEQIRGTKQHQATRRARPGRDFSDGASAINHELSCLGQVLKVAGLWTEIARFYEPLRTPKEDRGIALTEEEESHLFQVARKRKRWLVAYAAGLLSLSTTAGPSEIRHLRVRNLQLAREVPVMEIEGGAKNEHRVRIVPLVGDGLWAAGFLLERYRELCRRYSIAPDPGHYVLPHRAHRRGAPIDPTQPMGSWKKAWQKLREEAGKKFPRLLQVRRYDLRHTACTKMLEDPRLSYSTIEAIMGHRLGSRTKHKYDHIRDGRILGAVQAIDAGHAAREPRPAPVSEIPKRVPPARANLIGNRFPHPAENNS